MTKIAAETFEKP